MLQHYASNSMVECLHTLNQHMTPLYPNSHLNNWARQITNILKRLKGKIDAITLMKYETITWFSCSEATNWSSYPEMAAYHLGSSNQLMVAEVHETVKSSTCCSIFILWTCIIWSIVKSIWSARQITWELYSLEVWKVVWR